LQEFLEAIVLGIVQGLTEFLPVSSSGHLEIAKFLLNDDSVGSQSLLMTVVLHFATALSTLVVFRKDIVDIIARILKKENGSMPFVLKIILSMIPAAIEEMSQTDLCIVVGTSMQVYPAASLTSYLPTSTKIIYIDPNPQLNYELNNAGDRLQIIREKATIGLPELVKQLISKS